MTAKKFKLQSGHVVIVDECDAYILRSKVWNGYTNSNGVTQVWTRGGKSQPLSHFLAGEYGKHAVVHLNGNDLDFRRANLKAMTTEELGNYLSGCMKRGTKPAKEAA